VSIWAAVARAQHHQYVLGDVPAAVRLLRRCALQTARARAGRGGLGRGRGTGRGKSGGRGTLEDALQEGSDDGDGPAGDDATPAGAEEEEEDDEGEAGSDADRPERAQARLIARAERASLHAALGHALMESGEDGAAARHVHAALRMDHAFAPASRGLAVRVL